MSKQRFLIGITLTAVILSMAFAMAGCSGKGSSGAPAGQVEQGATFNIKGSSQLIALSNTVAPTTTTTTQAIKNKLAATFGGKPAFQYKVVNQGLSKEEVIARAKGKKAPAATSSQAASTTPVESGSNLLRIDENGNAELAIQSEYMIKVMYSVTDPQGEYVYFALDTGFLKPDGNDYTRFIAKYNCAFYRVSTADNTSSCVQEGVYIQPIDDTYMQRVSGNQKPIQFDAVGNMYFPGTTFTQVCDNDGICTMAAADWKPRIYRMKTDDLSVTALTQDNQKISYYLVLPTGEIAYQSMNIQTGEIALYLWKKTEGAANVNGTTTNLTGSTVGVDFFTVDNYNTIMWGGWNESGMRFARPAMGTSLIEKATLNTKNFWNDLTDYACDPTYYSYQVAYGGEGGAYLPDYIVRNLKQQNALKPYPPRRIVVGDDGRLYGLFEETLVKNTRTKDDWGNEICNSPDKMDYYTYLKIFQILPYSPIPKARIEFKKLFADQSFSWQQWMGSTPFQVSQGFLFYKDTKERIGFGNVDVIQMVRLSDGKTTTLLNSDNDVYQIYNWRLKGNKVYFAALDLSQTEVVTGEINTTLVASGALSSEYLSTKRAASAVGATGRVLDIEPIAAAPKTENSNAPYVRKFHISPDNVYSMSIEFSEEMDKAAVEKAFTFKDMSATPPTDISTMKVWINSFLHLIPDLSVNGTGLPNDALLDLKQTDPLKVDTQYDVTLTASALDTQTQALTDNSGANSMKKLFRTKPLFGFYVADGIGKTAGPPRHADYGYPLRTDMYDMNVYKAAAEYALPAEFRLQFKAKDNEAGYMTILVHDNTSIYGSNLFSLQIGNGWGNINYGSPNYFYQYYPGYGWYSDYRWANGTLPTGVMTGNWVLYQMDFIGSTASLRYSLDDGASWLPLIQGWQYYDEVTYMYQTYSTADVQKLVSRATMTTHLFLGMNMAMDFDDIAVWDATGGVIASAPLVKVDFAGDYLPHGVIASTNIKMQSNIANPWAPLTGGFTYRGDGAIIENEPEFLVPANTFTYLGESMSYPRLYTNFWW
ncbi:MAG: hypothetical protein OEW15_03225 [Nitrospirota bacterium]|nr:hypothetical protein [Nitrospirota bacterium]